MELQSELGRAMERSLDGVTFQSDLGKAMAESVEGVQLQYRASESNITEMRARESQLLSEASLAQHAMASLRAEVHCLQEEMVKAPSLSAGGDARESAVGDDRVNQLLKRMRDQLVASQAEITQLKGTLQSKKKEDNKGTQIWNVLNVEKVLL